MLTSSRPTKRKTSSLAEATSIEPALIISRAPKNSGARASSTWSWAIASRIRAGQQEAEPGIAGEGVVEGDGRIEVGRLVAQGDQGQEGRDQGPRGDRAPGPAREADERPGRHHDGRRQQDQELRQQDQQGLPGHVEGIGGHQRPLSPVAVERLGEGTAAGRGEPPRAIGRGAVDASTRAAIGATDGRIRSKNGPGIDPDHDDQDHQRGQPGDLVPADAAGRRPRATRRHDRPRPARRPRGGRGARGGGRRGRAGASRAGSRRPGSCRGWPGPRPSGSGRTCRPGSGTRPRTRSGPAGPPSRARPG